MQSAILRAAAVLRTWMLGALDDERGDLVQNLAWAAVSVVAIVAIGAALQKFGIDVVGWAQKQLGIG